MVRNTVTTFGRTPHSYRYTIEYRSMHTTHRRMYTYRNLLKTISALSYSKPEFSICSATKLASVNSGGFRPISVKCIKILLLNCRCRMVRTLSPTHTNMVVLAS